MFYQFNHLAMPGYLKIESGSNFCYPPHLHQCFEVIVILSGEMHVEVDGTTYHLKKNQGVLIFPNQIHSLESVKSEHVLCIFSPDLVQEFSTGVIGKNPVDNLFCLDDYLVDALHNLKVTSTITQKKGVLYSICAQFDNNRLYENRQVDKDGVLNKIFTFVEECYGKDCSLKKLAEILRYDYAYLSRIFRTTVGISYNYYVNHYRLGHACFLLENTSFSIIQCAYDSGYDSVRSFNRNFKSYLGLTPRQYRENNARL